MFFSKTTACMYTLTCAFRVTSTLILFRTISLADTLKHAYAGETYYTILPSAIDICTSAVLWNCKDILSSLGNVLYKRRCRNILHSQHRHQTEHNHDALHRPKILIALLWLTYSSRIFNSLNFATTFWTLPSSTWYFVQKRRLFSTVYVILDLIFQLTFPQINKCSTNALDKQLNFGYKIPRTILANPLTCFIFYLHSWVFLFS